MHDDCSNNFFVWPDIEQTEFYFISEYENQTH